MEFSTHQIEQMKNSVDVEKRMNGNIQHKIECEGETREKRLWIQ